MVWNCHITPKFKKEFAKLNAEQQRLARNKYAAIFRHNPFDPRLGAHKIHQLSARLGVIVFGAHLDGDLIVTFTKTAPDTVLSLDIGTHAIYK